MEETLFYSLAPFFHPEDPLVSFEVRILGRLRTTSSRLGNCTQVSIRATAGAYLFAVAFFLPPMVPSHLRCPTYIISGISNGGMQNYVFCIFW